MSATLNYQCSYLNPSKVVGSSNSSVLYFPRAIGQSLTSPQPSTPNNTNPTGALWLPTVAYDGQQFTLVASGSVVGSDDGETVNVRVRAVTGSLASPEYLDIAASGAQTLSSTPKNFTIEAHLCGDSQSGIL